MGNSGGPRVSIDTENKEGNVMKWNRRIGNMLLSSLAAGGVVALFISPLALTVTILPNQSTATPLLDESAKVTQEPEFLETTSLGYAANLLDPGEPTVVLQKYLEQNAHGYHQRLVEQKQNLDNELATWQVLAQQYPQSRHAYVGLANHYRTKAKASGDTKHTRQAADAYIRAAQIALEHGHIRYTRELADLSVELNDKAQLDEIFGRILDFPKDMDRDHYYLALVDYADALALLGDKRAWSYFEEAIVFHSENNIEAVNRYARHLLDWGWAQQAVAVLDTRLTPEQRVRFYLPAFLRKEALQKAGLDTTSADAEIDMVYQRTAEGSWVFARASDAAVQDQSAFSPASLSAPVGSFGSQSHLQALLQVFKMLLLPSPAAAQPWQHNNRTDDCRDQQYASAWWCDWYGNCFATVAVNLAEIIYNEARGETIGAQDTVAWTVRDRALEGIGCDSYPGGVNSTTCRTTLPCSRTGYCDLSKWFCCAIHGGTTNVGDWQYQFDDSHVDWVTLLYSGTHWEAVYVMNGYVPESSSGYILPGTSSCYLGCDGPWCNFGSNFYDAAPNGPMEFRGGYSNYQPQAPECKIPRLNFCGNGGRDNWFYGRLY